MLSFTTVVLSALVGAVYAQQNTTATPLTIATVKAQFQSGKIVPDVIPTFDPQALLLPNFGGSVGLAGVGQAITKDNVAAKPLITIAGLPNATAPTKYTVMMVDGNYVGSSNPQGLNLHYLQNDIVLGADGSANNGTSPATIPYAGPGPASGSGPHRYTLLMYKQPLDFKAPDSPAANSGVHLFNLADYVTNAKLDGPLAGSYFTVEVGTATVSVGPTSAVNPATLSVPASSGTGSSAASASKTGAPSPTKSGAAGKLAVSAVGSSVMGLFGAVALMM